MFLENIIIFKGTYLVVLHLQHIIANFTNILFPDTINVHTLQYVSGQVVVEVLDKLKSTNK